MIDLTTGSWQDKRTDESRQVEGILEDHFERVDAYRYNLVSIRVRVIDPRFKGLSVGRRDDLVDVYLSQLPESIQGDIMNLLTQYPGEEDDSISAFMLKTEFENPSPSIL